MSYLLENYNQILIYLTDGYTDRFIPKFRLSMVVEEPYLKIEYNYPEWGGNNRKIKLNYADVDVYGYGGISSAQALKDSIDDMILSGWTDINVGDILVNKGDLLSHNGVTDEILAGGANESILSRNNSESTGLKWITAAESFNLSGLKRMFCQCFYGDTGANLTLTNQSNAENFLAAVSRAVTLLDLTTYTQVRLVTRVQTGSASANSPRLRLRYRISFSTTVGDYSDIGTSEVSTSLTSTGVIDSGWVSLATGAKADVYVTVTQIGGDGAADPVIGFVNTYFR